MHNDFVDYLNTLHNLSGANANALAESQATNQYYAAIHVNRRIGQHIANLLRERPLNLILTGHAGDGKTGLLYQVLTEFGNSQALATKAGFDSVKIPGTSRYLLYVKDMSELAAKKQEELLLQSLSAAKSGNSSILVTNTGPLLNTLKRLQDSQQLPGEFRRFQSELLTAMDASKPTLVELREYSFMVVNMARVDNVGMAGLLLERLVDDQMWSPCTECSVHDFCPVLANAKAVKKNLPRVTLFIEAFLNWLQENDRRLTLRQILSHLAYALTSNLTCAWIHNRLSKTTKVLFDYHFANAFWGYTGIQFNNATTQIRGISDLRDLHLDETATPDDYVIFIKKDTSSLDPEIANLIENKLSSSAFFSTNLLEQQNIRRCVRRFLYLFASRQSSDKFDRLLECLFSPVFPVYARIQRGKHRRVDLEMVQLWIARGLYTSIVGVPPSDTTRYIHITVRPDRSGITGVQLLIGEVPMSSIEILPRRTEALNDSVDNRTMHQLVIKLKDSNQEHVVSLPLLDYLYRISEGAISTRLNPYLSHGIDRIKSSLVDTAAKFEDEVKLLILTANEPKILHLTVDAERLIAR